MILALVKMARACPEKSEAEIAELWRAYATVCAEEENIKQAVNNHQLGAFAAFLDWEAEHGGEVRLCDCLREDCPDLAKVYREGEGFKDPASVGAAGGGEQPLENCCGWCDVPISRCRCQEEICEGCHYPEDDCKCHLIDRCCPNCGSDGRCHCEDVEERVHYCGKVTCAGDCGVLRCGCIDKCKRSEHNP